MTDKKKVSLFVRLDEKGEVHLRTNHEFDCIQVDLSEEEQAFLTFTEGSEGMSRLMKKFVEVGRVLQKRADSKKLSS